MLVHTQKCQQTAAVLYYVTIKLTINKSNMCIDFISNPLQYTPTIKSTLQVENVHGILFSDLAQIGQIHGIKY